MSVRGGEGKRFRVREKRELVERRGFGFGAIILSPQTLEFNLFLGEYTFNHVF